MLVCISFWKRPRCAFIGAGALIRTNFVITISISKEDNVFSTYTSLPYGPSVNAETIGLFLASATNQNNTFDAFWRTLLK